MGASLRSPVSVGPSSAPEGEVAFTLDAFNRTQLTGPYLPDDAAFEAAAEIPIPTVHALLVGASGGGIWEINTSTRVGAYKIPTPGGVNAIALDVRSGEIWTAGDPSALAVVDMANRTPVYTNASLPSGPVAVAFDSLDDRVFVATRYQPTLCVFDASTHRPVAGPIQLSFTPSALYFDSERDRLYVGDMYGDRVAALNASSLRFDPTSWPVGAYPSSMALDPVHDWLYVANAGSSNLSVVNLTSGRLATAGIPTGPGPDSVTFDPTVEAMLVATDGGANNITVVPADGNGSVLPVASIPCEFCTGPIAFDPASELVFLPQAAPGGIPSTYLAVANLSASNPILPDIQLTFSFGASAFDPEDGMLYVIDPTGENGSGNPGRSPPYAPGNSSIVVVNGSDHRFTGVSYPVGYAAAAIAYDPANGDLYVANEGDGTVSVIAPGVGAVSLIRLGPSGTWNQTGPDALAVDPGRNLIYVADGLAGNVSVINGSAQAVSTTFPVGLDPDAVAFDTVSDRAFVANCGSDNLTIVNGTAQRPTRSVPVGSCPDALAVAAPGDTLWVANAFGPGGVSNLTVVDAGSLVSVASVSTGGVAVGLCYDPANGYVYVANGYANDVFVVNATSYAAAGTPIPVTLGSYETYPTAVGYEPRTGELFVSLAFTSALYVIANAPSVQSLRVNPPTGEVGAPLAFTVAVANGTAPYSFLYEGLPPGCDSSDASAVLCYPTLPGTYGASVGVTDANGYTGGASLTLTVAARLAVANLSASPSPIELGTNLTISVRVTGGVAPFMYYYSGLPPGCAGANVSELVCTPSTAGDYRAGALITDALAAIAVASINLTVTNPPPPAPLRILSFFPTQPNVEVNTSVTFQAVVVGGVDPVTIRYSGLPPGCVSVDFANLTCSPTTAGVYLVTLLASDGTGTSVTASTLLTVSNPPPPLVVALFAATPNPWTDGQTVVLQVITTGGTPPLKYSYGGLPGGCSRANSPRLSCTPTGPHLSTTVTVTITDAFSRGAFASLNLSWTSSGATQTPPPPAGGLSSWEWVAGIALGVAAGVAIAVAVQWIRRRPHQ